MRRSSSWKAEIRELPGGARQSQADSELAFERLTEDVRVCDHGHWPVMECREC